MLTSTQPRVCSLMMRSVEGRFADAGSGGTTTPCRDTAVGDPI